ncbi:TMEM164-related integral membrane acyltransferase [Corynebacterium casei]|uniref:YwaF family protein n=1 Tax=Corynebacterium casei TaxID=160386 RepID=UPI000EDA6E1F|nr:TIGR02206 family membrane protein [Corynebacterium casei]HCJ69228.1 TIGR02206 family membrane protein [Corynebacterium casei]
MTRPPLANVRPVLEEPWRSLSWVNPLESRYERMRQFRPLHFSMLVVSIITTGIFIMAAKHYERLGTLKKARVVSGWVLGVLGALWGLVSLDPKQRDVRETLPLHMCDVLRPIMSLALITGHPFALQLSTYWGIVFNPQAMLSPDLPYYFEPKWLRFSTYWFFHIVALAIPVALLATGMKLTWKGFAGTVAMTQVRVVATTALNRLFGSNYGFIAAHPNGHSLLSILGPWPHYLLPADIGVTSLFALLTAGVKDSAR